MLDRVIPKIDRFLKYINRTIYIYPIFIGIIILCLSYCAGIGQYGMGFAFVLGPVFYYFLKKEIDVKFISSNNLTSTNYNKLLIINIIFFVSFSLNIFILHSSIYHRSILYFLLVTISFFSIFMEILQVTSSKFSYFLILKIIFVSLSLRIGRLFIYPTIPGSDIHFHLNIAELIAQNGNVPDYSIAYKYSSSCLMHIFIAINDIILNLNLRDLLCYSMIFSTTIIVSLFIYCIVNKIYNTQTALIAVLFINIADMFFFQNVTNINPGAIVYCYLVVILFCIIQQKNRDAYSSIVVLMIYCMVFAHQLSTFCVFLILSTLLLSRVVYKIYFTKILKINLNSKDMELHLCSNTLTLFFTSLIFYWSQTGPTGSRSFFAQMIGRLHRTIIDMISEYFSEASAPTCGYETFFSTFNIYSNILYNLGSNFLLMLAIIGILFIVGSKLKSLFNFSYLSVVLMLFFLIYAGTYIGLGYLLIPHRFLPFLQLFLVIFASYSTYTIYTISSKDWKKFGLTGIVLFLIFFMITSPYLNNSDAIYSTDMVYRDQFTYSELKSLEWSNYFILDHKICVDSIVAPRPISTVDFLNLSTIQLMYLNNSSQNVLIRQYIRTNPDLSVAGTFGKISKYGYQMLISKVSQQYNLIYSTNSAEIYQKND
jgi:hypothetical protein